MTKDRAARIVTLAVSACQRAGYSDAVTTALLTAKIAADRERYRDPWSTPEFAHAVKFCTPKQRQAGE